MDLFFILFFIFIFKWLLLLTFHPFFVTLINYCYLTFLLKKKKNSYVTRIFGSKKQNEIGCLEREIDMLIWKAIEERDQQECSEKKDLLQLILEAASGDHSLDKDSCRRFIVDNCKSIYFAGHESTAVATSWCLMLLASHPDWQARIRSELAQVCPNGLPDANSLPHLKTVLTFVSNSNEVRIFFFFFNFINIFIIFYYFLMRPKYYIQNVTVRKVR